MDEGTYDLLSRGRAAAKAGDPQEARFFLEWLLRIAPESSADRSEALYWLSEIASDPAEKRSLLEDILALDPGDSRARLKIALLDRRIQPGEIVDPDRLPAEDPSSPISVIDRDAQRFTCPQCGGRLSYTPDGQSLACDYCDSRPRWESQSPGNLVEPVAPDDFLLSMATGKAQLRPVATQITACQGCGAEFLIPPQQISAVCPYCASAYVLQHAEERSLTPPGAVIPFRVNAAAASGGLSDWLAGNRLEPDRQLERPQGVYLPAWTFCMGGCLRWRGYRRQDTQEDDGWGNNTRRVLEDGTYPVVTSPVLIPAAARQQKLFTRLFPGYRLEEKVPYDPRYLVDWLAETYQFTAAQASLVARQQTLAWGKGEIQALNQGEYENLQVDSLGLTVETVQLILLPVWLVRYTVEGEDYPAVVNGQTGEVQAESPRQGIGGWLRRLLD
jgi:predicted RNA-binding Zn-ribbon protein involved in translation (DUF1610 family)